MMGILNRHFTLAIQFHDVLCGFLAVSRMGTAALEENMPQQPTAMREAVIYKILWNSRRRTTPWTGTGVLKFLQCAGVGTQGAPDFTDVLGPAYHGSQIRGILCPPLQGILRCEPRRPLSYLEVIKIIKRSQKYYEKIEAMGTLTISLVWYYINSK